MHVMLFDSDKRLKIGVLLVIMETTVTTLPKCYELVFLSHTDNTNTACSEVFCLFYYLQSSISYRKTGCNFR